MIIPNAQLQGLVLHPTVAGSEGSDCEAPPAIISSAHRWRRVRALAAGTHSVCPSIKVLYYTFVYLHGVVILPDITEV